MTAKTLTRAFVVCAALAAGIAAANSMTDVLAQGSGSGSGAAKGSGSGSAAGSGAGSASGSGSGSGSAADAHAGHGAQAKGDTSPSSKAFAEANAKMHKDMDIIFSGDADVDFVKGMVAHHMGAVDMAKIVMKYGKDTDIKKLAEEIVKAQEAEIVFMRAWLQKVGK